MRRIFQIAVSPVVLTAGLWSQTPLPAERQTRDTPAQRRDTQTPATGRIAGRVLSADTGRPVKRARVFVRAPELPEGRGALTDDHGLFDLTGLPASRYVLTASKSGFITLSYGQRRPLQAGTPLQLEDGQALTGIEFRLPRGGVIGGHLSDEDGDPIPGVAVRVMRYEYVQGERKLVAAGTAQTDDTGQYRVWGLMPGIYYVNAVSRLSLGYSGGGRGGRGNDMMGQLTSAIVAFGGANTASLFGQDDGTQKEYAPTYFPGVNSVNEAQAVTIALSEQTLNVDFNLQLVHSLRISGRVTNEAGAPVASGSVNLVPDTMMNSAALLGTSYGGPIGTDGAFAINNVPPGRYVLRARSTDGDSPLYASLPLTVGGADQAGVVVAVVPGATISGTVAFDGTKPDLQRFRVTAPSTDVGWSEQNPAAGVDADGRFLLYGLAAGFHLIRPAGTNQPGWMLRSVTVEGRDVTDTPIEVRSNQKLANVAVVMTSALSEINGTITDIAGAPVNDFTVLAFPTESTLWFPLSRHIMTARPDQTGKFALRGLPAGEFYLTTVDPAEQGEWFERAYLERHRAGAKRLSLGDSAVKTQDFKLQPRQ